MRSESGRAAAKPICRSRSRSANFSKPSVSSSTRHEWNSMTARILVVDDVLANVKLLEARLTAEYFDVVVAMCVQEALAICERGLCDIVLLDVLMPDLDGFEVCRRLKADPATHHIPVIMITALGQPSDRVRGLEAGADDFLTKPVSDIALVARVRSLVRLKMVTDELRMRAATSQEVGIGDPVAAGPRRYRTGRPRSRRGRPPGLLSAPRGNAVRGTRRRRRARSATGAVPCGGGRLRPDHGFAGPGAFRWLAIVQPDPLARSHPQHPDPGHRRDGGCRQVVAGPGDRDQRLPGAPDRPQRNAGPGPHPGPQEALQRPDARQYAIVDRDGDHRRADRRLQSPLHGDSSGDGGRSSDGARQAAHLAAARHRLFQVRQR